MPDGTPKAPSVTQFGSMSAPTASPAKMARVDSGRLMQSAVAPDKAAAKPLQFDPNESVDLEGGDEVSTVATPAAKTEATPAPTPTPTPEKKDDAVAPVVEDPAPTEARFDIPEDKPVEETPAPAPAQIPSGPRNYDSYPEEVRGLLRALPNKAFAEWAPRLKELSERAAKTAELEARVGQSPQFFYEHPEAYRLDPGYNELETRLNYINFESDHWAAQLTRIKRGEPWQALDGYDPQTGEPRFRVIQPPADGKVDYNAETQVSQVLTKLSALNMQKSQELAGFQASYRSSVERGQRELAEVDKRLFPNIPDVAKLPADEKKYYDMAVALAPQHLRNHPLVGPLGKSYVMFMRVVSLAQKLAKERDSLRAQLADRGVAEPADIPPGGGAATQKRTIKPGEIDPDEDVKLGEVD